MRPPGQDSRNQNQKTKLPELTGSGLAKGRPPETGERPDAAWGTWAGPLGKPRGRLDTILENKPKRNKSARTYWARPGQRQALGGGLAQPVGHGQAPGETQGAPGQGNKNQNRKSPNCQTLLGWVRACSLLRTFGFFGFGFLGTGILPPKSLGPSFASIRSSSSLRVFSSVQIVFLQGY